MFGLFKKEPTDCTFCEYYGELKSSDKVNPDKTITKGSILSRQCRQGEFELKDLHPCAVFKQRPFGQPIRFAIPMPKTPLRKEITKNG